ncbi:MAG: family 20 glycosylhydrolase [Ignavibacteriaceae bacterium]
MRTTLQAQINIIPIPQESKILNGNFIITPEIFFDAPGISNNLKSYFKDYLSNQYKIKLTDKNNKDTSLIVFQIDKNFLNKKSEAYSLNITSNKIEIISSSEEGIFRGIQTLWQLLPYKEKNAGQIKIQNCKITDWPQFSWRGLNLDCARHFMTKDFIKRYIDILAYYKFNVLHWHFTDDQGWRIEIKKYPKLTQVGAWRKEADGSIYGGFYTQEDVKEIVAYAQQRFITIVPEIEMPGHSSASLAAYPENSCTGGPFDVPITWGVFKDVYCAGRDSTFTFLENILDEVINLFPGKYIHIGGDEVPKDRWKACPKDQERMKSLGLKNEEELQSYFIKRISNYLYSKGKQVIGWDEILQGGLAPGAIVESWQSFQGAVEAANLGHYTLSSPASFTYLNSSPEDLGLRTVYSFNPIPDGLPANETKYILGGEASLWTENCPQEKVDSQLFPRILALSEVFWTDPKDRDYKEFHSRVEKAYEDLTAHNTKYGPESKTINFSTSYNKEKKEFTVNLSTDQKGLTIRYTENGNEPDSASSIYAEPIKIYKTVNLKIAAFRNGHAIGKQTDLSFDFHKALNAKLTILNPYSERYPASGENTLIDGVRGTDNFRDGLWQGYEGEDFDAVIDLGKVEEISKVTPRFLLNTGPWIFLPTKVIVSLSKDGKNYLDERSINNDVPEKNPAVILKDYPVNFDKQEARFIKIKAVSIKKCPPWHPGAGGKAWLFIDEIEVK